MIERLNRRRTGRGFTLIELLIVILILAILMAITIPNFLGSRQKAGDRSAQQVLRTAASSVKAYSSDVDDFTGVTAASLAAQEPNIDWKDGSVTASGNDRPVGFDVPATNTKVITLTAPGADKVCWLIQVHLDATADQYGAIKDTATCDPAAAAASWDATKAREFPKRP